MSEDIWQRLTGELKITPLIHERKQRKLTLRPRKESAYYPSASGVPSPANGYTMTEIFQNETYFGHFNKKEFGVEYHRCQKLILIQLCRKHEHD